LLHAQTVRGTRRAPLLSARKHDVLTEVNVGTLEIERLIELLDPSEAERIRLTAVRARQVFGDRTIWNVNSTARGGGVAEMLQTLLAYARGSGIDTRWLVIDGDLPFFTVTKRIHNRLHGAQGDGGPLGDDERAVYERALDGHCDALLARVLPGDVVILHDPQTAGLAPRMRDHGAIVVWRCHVGLDDPNEAARQAWDFLAPYVDRAEVVVFSREQFAWDVVDPDRRRIIAPSIDALAPKNQELTDQTVDAILRAARIRTGGGFGGAPAFRRFDGSQGVVHTPAEMDEDRPLGPEDPYVLQVSRWDALKDPQGVIDGFARFVAPHTDAHLVYAGPAVEAVSDDPEGATVLADARAQRAALDPAVRDRVHLAMLPMDDLEENAAIVNALQRHAAVVVQKSLAEGFGLTVAEAMWKARPVVASRIGGIADQVEDGRSGLLVDDPGDLEAYGLAVRRLLEDPPAAEVMGAAARERIRAHFLGTRSLDGYARILEPLIVAREAAAP
jgi:trehalose synthase